MKCETLDVWKRSCRLSVNVYKLFADSKDLCFKDQISRSSLSVASYIAEGLEKDSDKEKGRFIEIAKGSAAELITQVYIGIEIGYINKSVGISLVKESDEILKTLRLERETMSKNLALTTYHLTLDLPIGLSIYKPLDTLPSELPEFLPDSEEIADRLSTFDDENIIEEVFNAK